TTQTPTTTTTTARTRYDHMELPAQQPPSVVAVLPAVCRPVRNTLAGVNVEHEIGAIQGRERQIRHYDGLHYDGQGN
nr:hypothetical protein [Micromonospora sp. DSM 115978]